MHPKNASQIKKLPSSIRVLRFNDEELILENLGVWSRRIDGDWDILPPLDFFSQVIESSLTCPNQGKNCTCETNYFTQTGTLATANFFAASVLFHPFSNRSCW